MNRRVKRALAKADTISVADFLATRTVRKAFAGYIDDIINIISKRYKTTCPKVLVGVSYDKSQQARGWFAYDRYTIPTITLNSAFADESATRASNFYDYVGVCAHEAGHALYSDMEELRIAKEVLSCGGWYPRHAVYPAPLDAAKAEIEQQMATNQHFRGLVANAICHISNIIEDGYVNDRLADEYGKFAIPIVSLKNLLAKDRGAAQFIEDVCDNTATTPFAQAHQLLYYGAIMHQFPLRNAAKARAGYPIIDTVMQLMPDIRKAQQHGNAHARIACAVQCFVSLWPFIKDDLPSANPPENQNERRLADKVPDSAEGKNESTSKPSEKPEPSEQPESKNGAEADGEESAENQPDHKGQSQKKQNKSGLPESDASQNRQNDPISDYESVLGDLEGEGSMERREISGSALFDKLEKEAIQEHEATEQEKRLRSELNAFARNLPKRASLQGAEMCVERVVNVTEQAREHYAAVVEPHLRLSRRMRESFMETIRERKTRKRITGLYSGSALHIPDLVSQDRRGIFSKKIMPANDLDLALAVLVDESGSMSDKFHHARLAASLLYDTASSLGIPVCVYGHSTEPMIGRGSGDVHCYLRAYAEFEAADGQDNYRIMGISSKGSNHDGCALLYTFERLKARPEKNRILIIISDGMPAGNNYSGDAARKDMAAMVHEYKNRCRIDTIAAALQMDEEVVASIYGAANTFNISDVERLPNLLTRVLLNRVV